MQKTMQKMFKFVLLGALLMASGLPAMSLAALPPCTDEVIVDCTPIEDPVPSEEESFDEVTITAPAEDEEISGYYTLTAEYFDNDETVDGLEWYIFSGSCASEEGELWAYYDDEYTESVYEAGYLEVYIYGDDFEAGEYCFEVDPIEQELEEDVFDNVTFNITETTYVISGYKYEDSDGDKALSYEVDTPVANWTIIATEVETGETYTAMTDDDGYYELAVPAGVWRVTEDMPSGWRAIRAYYGSIRYIGLPDSESESEEEIFMDCEFTVNEDSLERKGGNDCTFLNERYEEPRSTQSGTKVGVRQTGKGQVLGASTSSVATTTEPVVVPGLVCDGMYLKDYMRANQANNPDEVKKLQVFLAALGFMSSTSVSGIFDETTDAAVRSFQIKYLASVLTPWGLSNGTGYVYKTTRYTINNMVCPGSEAMPKL